MHSWEPITNLRAKKSAVSSCWRSQEFPVLHYRLCFLQCNWRRDICLQKVININEARGISRMSPDPLSRRLGLGTRLTELLRLKMYSNDSARCMYLRTYYAGSRVPGKENWISVATQDFVNIHSPCMMSLTVCCWQALCIQRNIFAMRISIFRLTWMVKVSSTCHIWSPKVTSWNENPFSIYIWIY